MKYYIAYGSNLNIEEMKMRCPFSVPICTTVIENYRLAFKGALEFGFLTLEESKDSLVPVTVYMITEMDEANLDEYEGYPMLYQKKTFKLNINGIKRDCFTYIMNPNYSYNLPSSRYLERCMIGYRDFNIAPKYLMEAYEYTKAQLPKKLIK